MVELDENAGDRQIFFIGPDEDRGGLRAELQNAWKPDVGRFKPWNVGHQGSITHELVADLAESFAVLADVRDDNPNVYYEIGLAHAFDTPVIPFTEPGRNPSFDIADQSAINVQLEDNGENLKSPEHILREVRKRLGSLQKGPSRTAVSAYQNERELQRLQFSDPDHAIGLRASRLPTDGWDYLATHGGLVHLTDENAAPGNHLFHLAHGIGKIIDHSLTRDGWYEVRAMFTDGPKTLVLPDPSAYLAEPSTGTALG